MYFVVKEKSKKNLREIRERERKGERKKGREGKILMNEGT